MLFRSASVRCPQPPLRRTPVPQTNCWLSVLVPAFNVEAHVGGCLGSILAQIRPGVEVVVIDDASVDATSAIVAAAQRDHPEVLRSHHQSVNAGVATTRNRLVRAARGDYLWFIDADDVVADGAIEALQTIVDCHGPDLVLCDFRPLGRRRTHRRTTFRGPSRTLIRNPSDVAAGMLYGSHLILARYPSRGTDGADLCPTE